MDKNLGIITRNAVEYATAAIEKCDYKTECLMYILKNLETSDDFLPLLNSLNLEIKNRLATGHWSTNSN